MNYKPTLILLAVAVALGIFILAIERRLPRTEEHPGSHVFNRLNIDEVTAVEIVSPDRTLAFEKRTGGGDPWWEIVKPIKARADRQIVTGLLSDIRWLSRLGGLSEADVLARGLAAFGLEKPAASVVCRLSDETFRLDFGSAGPVKDDEVFVRAQGEGRDGVYLVEKKLLDTLRKPVEDFQDRAIFTYDSWKTDKIELTLGGEEVVLLKKENDWHLDKPEDVREKAEYSPVSTLLNDLKEIRWKEWVEEKPADLDKYGLKAPASRVRVTSSETQKTEALLFGTSPKDKPDRTYARKGEEGPVVTVETAALKKIPDKVNVFRSKKPFNLTVDSLQKIELKVGGQACAIERAASGDNWTVAQPVGQKTDIDEISGFVGALNGTEIVDFYERRMTAPKTYGFDQAAAWLGLTTKTRVTSTTGEGDKKETKTEDKLELRSWVFGSQGDRVFMKREDQGQVVEVPSKLLTRLRFGTLNFRSKRLVDTKPENIQAFTLERAVRGQANPVKYECVREAGQWKLIAPAGAEADAQRVLDVRSELYSIHAVSWVAAMGDRAAYGLDHPLIRVDFTWTETKEVKKEKPAPNKGAGAGEPPKEEKKAEGEKKDEVEKVTETFRKVLCIGSPTKAKDGYYGQIEGDPAIFTIGNSTFEHLDQDLVKKPD